RMRTRPADEPSPSDPMIVRPRRMDRRHIRTCRRSRTVGLCRMWPEGDDETGRGRVWLMASASTQAVPWVLHAVARPMRVGALLASTTSHADVTDSPRRRLSHVPPTLRPAPAPRPREFGCRPDGALDRLDPRERRLHHL